MHSIQLSTTGAASPTLRTYDYSLMGRMEIGLSSLGWVVIPRNEVMDNGQVGELDAPTSPLTNPS